MSILVIDVGTSGVRGAIVRPDASVAHIHHVPVLPDSPFPGLVEFDGMAIAAAVQEVASVMNVPPEVKVWTLLPPTVVTVPPMPVASLPLLNDN